MLTMAELEQTDTYQQILKKGMSVGISEGRLKGLSEGRAQASRDLLITLGTEKFGPPPIAVFDQIQAISDPVRLADFAVRLLRVSDWHSLFTGK